MFGLPPVEKMINTILITVSIIIAAFPGIMMFATEKQSSLFSITLHRFFSHIIVRIISVVLGAQLLFSTLRPYI